jgi:hypothetical protein
MAPKTKDSGMLEIWQQGTRAGDDGLRRLVEQQVVQEVLEGELASFLGMQPYQHTGERRHRPHYHLCVFLLFTGIRVATIHKPEQHLTRHGSSSRGSVEELSCTPKTGPEVKLELWGRSEGRNSGDHTAEVRWGVQGKGGTGSPAGERRINESVGKRVFTTFRPPDLVYSAGTHAELYN